MRNIFVYTRPVDRGTISDRSLRPLSKKKYDILEKYVNSLVIIKWIHLEVKEKLLDTSVFLYLSSLSESCFKVSYVASPYNIFTTCYLTYFITKYLLKAKSHNRGRSLPVWSWACLAYTICTWVLSTEELRKNGQLMKVLLWFGLDSILGR